MPEPSVPFPVSVFSNPGITGQLNALMPILPRHAHHGRQALKPDMEPGRMAQLAQSVKARTPEDPVSVSGAHIKMQARCDVLVIPAKGR